MTEVVLPKLPPGTGWGFEEVARRNGDFALAAVAVTLTVADGTITQARIAMTGVDETPKRADDAEAMLAGKALEPALRDAAIDAVRGRHAATPTCMPRPTIAAIWSACWRAGARRWCAWRRAGGAA